MMMTAFFVDGSGKAFEPDSVSLQIKDADSNVAQTLSREDLRHTGVGRYEYDYPLQEGEEPPDYLFIGTIS